VFDGIQSDIRDWMRGEYQYELHLHCGVLVDIATAISMSHACVVADTYQYRSFMISHLSLHFG
jgi:hypothetical protein